MLKASGTVLSEGEASMAADEDVRGRFRRRSVGRTLSLGSLRIFDLYSQRSLRQGLGAYLGNLWKAAPANNPQEARHALNRA
ncbi:hypothetical protein ACP3TJ_12550 [Desulforudis sp. 1088]|uniref:hypothetical protein n=1 Tax=unclassified Candidatus Desulforudis TaxID=2635950 RepID=UPI003CEADC6A